MGDSEFRRDVQINLLAVRCPRCGAQAGQQCQSLLLNILLDRSMSYIHEERVEAAKGGAREMSDG